MAGTRLPDDLSSRTDISELHKYFWIGEEVLKNSRFTVPQIAVVLYEAIPWVPGSRLIVNEFGGGDGEHGLPESKSVQLVRYIQKLL